MNDTGLTIERVLRTDGLRLHAMLYRMTLSSHAADDLLQELCLRLMRSAAFAGASNPTAFAFRAAVNLAIEHRRYRNRHPARQLHDRLPATAPDPPELTGRREELEHLLRAVERLRQPLREIVILRYIEGAEYEEIAAILGKNPQQIRGLAHKGVVALRDLLNTEHDRGNRGRSHATHH